MLENLEASPHLQKQPPRGRHSRPKPAPFKKESDNARQRKDERERRELKIEETHRKRQAAREEHDRFRKAMDKARKPGRDGQRRLGRESRLLPQMVENLLGRLQDQKEQPPVIS